MLHIEDDRRRTYNLQVLLDLRTSSPSWKLLLASSGQDQQYNEESEEEAEESEESEEEEEENEGGDDDDSSAPLHVAVFYGLSENSAIADFTLLRKLWQCVGLPAHGDDAGSDQQSQAWKGKEVLITLLACLGFAWHDDVNRLWEDNDDDNDDDADTVTECEHGRACIGGCADEITALLKTSRFKHKELQDLAPYVTQLNAFLDARQQSASAEVRAFSWCCRGGWAPCRAVPCCDVCGGAVTSLISFGSRRESWW
jgi:hypothetical protein